MGERVWISTAAGRSWVRDQYLGQFPVEPVPEVPAWPDYLDLPKKKRPWRMDADSFVGDSDTVRAWQTRFSDQVLQLSIISKGFPRQEHFEIALARIVDGEAIPELTETRRHWRDAAAYFEWMWHTRVEPIAMEGCL